MKKDYYKNEKEGVWIMDNNMLQTPQAPEVPVTNSKLASWKIFFKKLKRNKAAMVGGYFVFYFLLSLLL